MKSGIAAVWAVGIVAYGVWMLTLLVHPLGRAQGIVLLVVTAIGYGFRSAASLKWTLVILTFEGSIRVGMLLSLMGSVWRKLAA
jgi:hypothetical protein